MVEPLNPERIRSPAEPSTEKARGRKMFKPQARPIDFIEESTGFQSGSQKRSGLKLALWTWLSATIDTLVLTSMSCFFVVLFSFLMKTPVKAVINQFVMRPQLGEIFVIAFLVSIWIYFISMRVIMGASMGEWTCQLRLGQPMQRLHVSYIFKVTARTTLILLTGVLFFPLLSLICKRDVVGMFTGLKIYSLK